MGKKKGAQDEPTIENRVYLFKDLAAAFLADHGDLLTGDGEQRHLALRALGDLAYASCVVADTAGLEPSHVARRVASGPSGPGEQAAPHHQARGEDEPEPSPTPGKKAKRAAPPRKPDDAAARRGWGGGHGGG